MSKIALVLLVIIVFLIVVIVVLFTLKGKPEEDPNSISVKLEKGTAVNIVKDDDSTVRVEYTSFADRPRAVEVFPDLVSNLVEQETDLNEEFWDEFQRRDELPYERRKELTERLVRHGWLRREDVEKIVIPAPVDPETGEPVTLPPDPSGEDAEAAIREWMNRPFE